MTEQSIETKDTMLAESSNEIIISDELDDDSLEEVIAVDQVAALTTNSQVHQKHTIKAIEAGNRFDKIAAQVFTDFSRVQLQTWISEGNLTVNSKQQKSKYRVKQDDILELEATITEHSSDQPEDIAIDVVYEDESVVVINKPVGMVVHPGAGNWTGTLVNALLFHYPENSHMPRAGLVHRIDKDTSGLLIIAKNKGAQLDLMEQLKDKSVYRHYQCVVAGQAAELRRIKVIDQPISRHKTQRTKMSVIEGGKESVTHLTKITPVHENYSLIDVSLETGRTHQIRVHLSHMGHPLVGDKVYGQRKQLRAGMLEYQREFIRNFPRQALHAYKLGFIHPDTEQEIEVTAPLPADIEELIAVLSEKEE